MYQSILLPIDLGHKSLWEKAAPVATNLAAHYGAKIHVLTVVPDYGMPVVGSYFPRDFAENALKEVKKQLEAFAQQHIPDVLRGEVRAVSGSIYKRILIHANELGCDLIVLSSHRPEKADFLIGPNAARVVRHANQSVFVVR